jgi:hypothetical protein
MADNDKPSRLDYASQRAARTWKDELRADFIRFRNSFTRDNVIGHLKTLAWVVPLTLLIWIWAEREQVATMKDVSVPFKIVTSDDRVATVKVPEDMNLVLELQGPQGRLQEVLDELRGGKGTPRGLDIELPPSLEVNREHRPDTLTLLRNHKTFVSNGVTVLSVQPARMDISLDQVVEREAQIIAPPELKNLRATFDPAMVKVRGPLSLLTRATQADPAKLGRLVLHAEIPQEIARTPGPHELSNVLLRKPDELNSETVTVAAPPKVRANIAVSQADKTTTIRSMPVTLDVPDGLLEKFKSMDFRPVLQNVTVTGPPEIIDRIEAPDFEPKPKARVVVTQQDVGEPRQKQVVYDLPPGVEVSEEDKRRTVEVHLVDRSTLAPS